MDGPQEWTDRSQTEYMDLVDWCNHLREPIFAGEFQGVYVALMVATTVVVFHVKLSEWSIACFT
jgi:hypothetical protein